MGKVNLNVKSVIFDMDGVITNTMPDHYKSWKIVLKEEGLNVTHFDIYSREGQTGIKSMRGIFHSYGKTLSIFNANRILKKKETLFKKMAKQRFIVGSRTFLKHLHQSGFQLALVTGTSRHELHKILPNNLYNLFTAIVTGSDVKKGKPHPEPFLKALKMLQVNSRQAVVVENAPSGIESAKSAKIQCIAIETSLAKEHLKQADYIYKSIKDLRNNVSFKLQQ